MPSKGEVTLEGILKEEFPNFRIESQVPLKLGRKTLYVDFAIPVLGLAFEYDGRQHSEYVPFFHATKRGFRVSKGRDTAKAKALSEAGYTLIRINFNERLSNELVRNRIKEACSE